MLPVPSVLRRARQIARAQDCTAVLFGAAAPLGLLAPALRDDPGIERFVALTHGHEAAWAQLPGARSLLRRIGTAVDVVTYLGEYTRGRIAGALPSSAAARMVQLPPGVNEGEFRPGAGGAEILDRLGLADRPVVVCVSRLVPRKGQDTLIRSLPEIHRRAPGTAILIVGGGPYRKRLEQMVDDAGLAGDVVFTGSVPWADLPEYFDAGDVFAMPCRTRRGGLDVEGLGIVYLEASATGLPVVAGDSGGAPDAVIDGETGYVVDGRSAAQVAERIADLLDDPAKAKEFGRRGRDWIERAWRWDLIADRLHHLLLGPA
jgi:phosphatidylinositol alpha-1,6-mannosyltransferase